MNQNPILLNPGPVTLSAGVREAMLRPDLCHREPEFADLCLSIKHRLVSIYSDANENYEAVLLTGSGSCAVEAMINSLAPQHATTLVVANGVYGERIEAMLEAASRPHELIKGDWSKAMDLAAVEHAFENNPAISHVVAVHNETTTGRLNDIASLAKLCQAHDKALMIDAVSSFAGELIDFSRWQPLAVAATANKCLHSIPGMAFVLVKLSELDDNYSQAQTLYLDLFRYYQEQKTGFSPFTQSVQAAYALDAAIDELNDNGGWQARHKRYMVLSRQIQNALIDMEMPLLLEQTDYSSMISSFHLPENWDYKKLHGTLKQAGFIIYAGQGHLQKMLFRIANMGNISDSDWTRLINVFKTQVYSTEVVN